MRIPVISVIMPVYNGALFLKGSIESVLAQTFVDFEFIILDDGSTDESLSIIKSYSYSDLRIKLVLCEHNYIDTLNKGIDLARGKYIARMDADDLMLPERLETQYNFMEENPDIVACGSYIQTFGQIEGLENNYQLKHEDILDTMVLGNPIANPTTIMRRNEIAVNKIYYDKEYPYAEDYKFWFEVSKIGKLANIPKVLLKYRINDHQVSFFKGLEQRNTTQIIQREVIEYFINKISIDHILGKIVREEFWQSLEKINEYAAISNGLYYNIMYELIKNLRARTILFK